MSRVPAHLAALLHVISGRMTTLREDGERGATAIEYGLLVGLIAVAIIATMTIFSSSVSGLFSTIASGMAAWRP